MATDPVYDPQTHKLNQQSQQEAAQDNSYQNQLLPPQRCLDMKETIKLLPKRGPNNTLHEMGCRLIEPDQ